MSGLWVRPLAPEDAGWVRAFLAEQAGSSIQARAGEVVDAASLPGLVALDEAGRRVGLLTWLDLGPRGWEVVTIHAGRRGEGIGTLLIEAIVAAARAAGVRRLELTTTNDNLPALHFYQRRGFRLVALRSGAVDAARREIKPSIPAVGEHDIPIRDEIVLERDLE